MSTRGYSTVNVPGLASAPAVGIAGDLYYDTALGLFRVSNGSAWVSLAPIDSPTFTGTVNAALLDLTTAATATAATSYWVETGSDGILRPKTLANVKAEVVTTAAVNTAAATTVGTVTSGVWNAGAITSSGTVSATGLAGSLLSAANPLALGTVGPGTSAIPSRQDHVHPTTGLALDSLVVHLAGTETITGAKTFSLPVNIGNSSAMNSNALKILAPGSQTIQMSNLDTNNTTKYTLISMSQYGLTADPEGFSLIGGIGGSSNNDVAIGGYFGETNAATSITFYTAANTTTLSGTARMSIDSGGTVNVVANLTVGTTIAATSTISASGLAGSLLSSANPLALGTVGPGTSAIPSRQDHVHPTTGLMANPMTTLGDVIYGGASGTPTRLAGDTSNANRFLRSVSSGGVAAAPSWQAIAVADVTGAATDSLVVHLAGTETITGQKSFTNTATYFSSASSSSPQAIVLNTNTDANGGYFILRKMPSDNAIVASDSLGTLMWQATDTAGGVRNAAYITAIATGANTATYVPTRLDFYVTSSAGTTQAGLTLNSDQSVQLYGALFAPAATTSIPSIRLPHGTAPSSPTNGDVWTTTGGMWGRINGLTVQHPGIVISDTAPTPAYTGLIWLDSVSGGTFIYYDSFWVEIGSAGGQLIAPVTITGTAAASIPLTIKGAPSQSVDFFQIKDSSNTVLLSLDTSGGLNVPTGPIKPRAGSTGEPPILFTTGSNLSSAAQGAVEWDGDSMFTTADTTNGPGRQVNVAIQRVYLASAASAITTGTDFFPSLRPMMKASKLIHFRYQLMFTKNTAGTVTFQLKNSAAANFTFIQATFQLFLQATGALAAVGDIQMGYAAGAATLSFGATKSLTAAANYTAIIEGWCVAASNTRLSVAPSAYGAGTITTIVGSTMWCADYGTYNTNYGNLG